MPSGEVFLKTPFVVQKFSNIQNFIITIFPDLESYLKEKIEQGIKTSDLSSIAFSKLQDNFRSFIVRGYSKEIDNYLYKEASHIDKKTMKEVLLSTVSITLNVSDADGHKLTEHDYFNSLRNIINKID